MVNEQCEFNVGSLEKGQMEGKCLENGLENVQKGVRKGLDKGQKLVRKGLDHLTQMEDKCLEKGQMEDKGKVSG